MVNQVAESALTDEIARLRHELVTSRAVSARALARATRLAQLVSVLAQLTDVADILERSVCEVAEQFSADIAVVLTPIAGDLGELELAAQWGIAARDLPPGACGPPPGARQLTARCPVLAGPATDVTPPEWLSVAGPRHFAVGLLTVRADILGYLLLVRRADDPYSPAETQELGAVVNRIALAFDNGQLYRRTQEQLHRLRRLHEVTVELARIVDPVEVVRALAQTLVAEVPVSGAAVYLDHNQRLDLAGAAGDMDDAPPHLDADERPDWPDWPDWADWADRRDGPDGPDTVLLPLCAGASHLGALLLTGAPRPDSDAGSFMDHLADIGALTLEKAFLFDRIRAQAESDVLTGLANRSLFMDRLAAALQRCRQAGSDLSVIFVDLDGFKEINDTHGHDVGDALLIQVSKSLTRAVRELDTVARLGGDEFVVLCEDVTWPEANTIAREQVQPALEAPFRLAGGFGALEIRIGGSVGVGMAKEAGYDASTVLRTADAAMYAAKERRRPPLVGGERPPSISHPRRSGSLLRP